MKKRKIIPSLRSLVDEEQATAKKARASWQLFTIMAEFIEATEYLSEIRPAVCIYGSARIAAKLKVKPAKGKKEIDYYSLTMEIARKLSDAGFAVISGGGPGIMEAANKGAHKGKSPSVGLNIELPHEQSNNKFQDISLRFRHFFTRKVTFAKNSDAVIVMPGGFGTLDELCEVLTLMQTKKTRHVPLILVGKEFWGGLLSWFEQSLLKRKLISKDDMSLIQVLEEPDEILEAVLSFYKKKKSAPKEATKKIDDQMFYL